MSAFARSESRGCRPNRFLLFKLALRELRGGIRGFYVFIACVAIGVMAIAGVGSIAQGLTEGLARAGAARAVAVTMAGPLFGLAFDLLFFGQLPTVASSVGTLVVVAALMALGALKPSVPITQGEAE